MKQVLIVDDSKVIRKVAQRILASLDFLTREAENGLEALNACRAMMPDAVLLDWNMPVMDGITFLEALRELEGRPTPEGRVLHDRERGGADRPRAAIRRRRIHHEALRQADPHVEVRRGRPLRILTRRPGVSVDLAEQTWGRPNLTASRRRSAALSRAGARRPAIDPDIVVIGASTGGPQALVVLLVADAGPGARAPPRLRHAAPAADLMPVIAGHVARTCARADRGRRAADRLLDDRPRLFRTRRPAPVRFRPHSRQASDILLSARHAMPRHDVCRPARRHAMFKSAAAVASGRARSASSCRAWARTGSKARARSIEAGGNVLIVQDKRHRRRSGECPARSPKPISRRRGPRPRTRLVRDIVRASDARTRGVLRMSDGRSPSFQQASFSRRPASRIEDDKCYFVEDRLKPLMRAGQSLPRSKTWRACAARAIKNSDLAQEPWPKP